MSEQVDYTIESLGKDKLVLSGVVNVGNVMAFVNELTSRPYRLSQDLTLDMAELFFEDGMAILITINIFRSLAPRLNSLNLHYPSKAMMEGLEGNGILLEPGLNVQLVRQQTAKTETESVE